MIGIIMLFFTDPDNLNCPSALFIMTSLASLHYHAILDHSNKEEYLAMRRKEVKRICQINKNRYMVCVWTTQIFTFY